MLRAKSLGNARDQNWVIFTADQQLYKVACQIIWSYPENFSSFILSLGGMHYLMSFVEAVGANTAGSGVAEVLESTFFGVTKMLTGKKFPQNIRALKMLTEELLRGIFQDNPSIQSMNALQTHLDILCSRSRTAKLWINNIVRPTFIIMKFVRAERENAFLLHLKAVEDAIPYCFSAGHVNYARYGVHYLLQMQSLPEEVRCRCKKREHTLHLKSGIWNGIWYVNFIIVQFRNRKKINAFSFQVRHGN